MSQDNEYENLSALVDGELSDDQVRFMLRRADAHRRLCAAWDRYHIIGSAVRGELTVMAGEGFVDGVMDRITRERDTVATPSRPHAHRWLRWSGGGAIAAAVAVAALIVVQPQMQHAAPATAQVAANEAAPPHLIAATSAAPDAAGAEAEPVADIPAAPLWLQALPSAGQFAVPAAAHFTSLDQWMRMNEQPGYYQRQLAPYVQPTDRQAFDNVSFHGPYLPQTVPSSRTYPGQLPE